MTSYRGHGITVFAELWLLQSPLAPSRKLRSHGRWAWESFVLRILFWAAAAAILFASPSFAEPGATGGDLGQVNKTLSGAAPVETKPVPIAQPKQKPRQQASKRETTPPPQVPPRQAAQPSRISQQRAALAGETCSSIQSTCLAACASCQQECLSHRNTCIRTGTWQGSVWTISGVARQ